MNMFRDIVEFHVKFRLKPPTDPDEIEELLDFRTKFMEEELEEFKNATTSADRFDALLDLVYVAMGTAFLLKYPWDYGWTKVHEANLKKVRARSASDSKRGSRFDVVKPIGWKAPSFAELFDE